jgi:hypothetical protein
MTIGAGWAEGAWVDASWVVGAWAQPTATKTIGGTSQLEAFASSGTLTVQNQETIGGTSQLEVFNSTGGINLGFSIGGTSQLQAFTSSGFIQVGDVVVVDTDQPTGGWGYWFDYEQHRKNAAAKDREKEKRKAKQIEDEIHRALALEERKLEAESARVDDLNRLNQLVEKHQQSIVDLDNPRLTFVMQEALEKHTFSTNERLERTLSEMREEEFFLMQATMILLNQ